MPDRLPKVSIVTAVLNGERFIRQCVESVLRQQGPFELEYLVQDGRSTDATLDILAEYESDPRLSVVSRPDNSPQQAITAGMSRATGSIGAWLNADDIYEAGALATVVEAFRRHPDRHWLYGKCRIIDERGCEVRRPVTLYKNLVGMLYSRHVLLCENFINQPATFWHMDLWRRMDSLNSSFKAAWDYELWVNMAAASRPVHVRRYLANFRRHNESISEQHFERQFREELAVALAHAPAPHRLIHRVTVALRIWAYRLLNR